MEAECSFRSAVSERHQKSVIYVLAKAHPRWPLRLECFAPPKRTWTLRGLKRGEEPGIDQKVREGEQRGVGLNEEAAAAGAGCAKQ